MNKALSFAAAMFAGAFSAGSASAQVVTISPGYGYAPNYGYAYAPPAYAAPAPAYAAPAPSVTVVISPSAPTYAAPAAPAYGYVAPTYAAPTYYEERPVPPAPIPTPGYAYVTPAPTYVAPAYAADPAPAPAQKDAKKEKEKPVRGEVVKVDGNKLTIKGMRIRDTEADGVNFHTGVTNSTVTNSDIRNAGDDVLRFAAVYAEPDVVTTYERAVQPDGSAERHTVS